MKALFISDLHLCDERPETIRAFLAFLHTTACQTEALYILGDLFEYWAGDDDDDDLDDEDDDEEDEDEDDDEDEDEYVPKFSDMDRKELIELIKKAKLKIKKTSKKDIKLGKLRKEVETKWRNEHDVPY